MLLPKAHSELAAHEAPLFFLHVPAAPGGLAVLTSPRTQRQYPLNALWQLQLPTYEPGSETCPACAAGIPLHAPGSTGTAAS